MTIPKPSRGSKPKVTEIQFKHCPFKKTIFASIHSDESLTVHSQRVDETLKAKSVKFGSICESAPDLKLSNPVYCIQVVFDRGKYAILGDSV